MSEPKTRATGESSICSSPINPSNVSANVRGCWSGIGVLEQIVVGALAAASDQRIR